MLIKNAFLVWLIKIKQVFKALYFELGTTVHYVSDDTYWCPISVEKTIKLAEHNEQIHS